MTDNKAVAQLAIGLGDFELDLFKRGDSAKGSATGEDVREAMGSQKPRLPRIKVKHQGSAIFAKADGSKPEALEGVIVAHTFHNSFFGKDFDDNEDGDRPLCFSNDAAVISDRAEEPQATGCHVCPRNRDARAKDAREAAFERSRKECCNNYLSLAVVLRGEEVPYVVQFPNTSFRSWADFNQTLYGRGRFLPHEVGTRITLKNTKRGNTEYSVGQFEMLGPLPAERRPAYARAHEDYLAVLRRDAADGERDVSPDAKEAIKRAKAAEDRAAQGEAAL